MTPFLIDDDDGFGELEFKRADRPEVKPVKIVFDVFELFERLRAIAYAEITAAEKANRTTDTATPMREWLNARFDIECSGAWADRFYGMLRAEASRLAKKGRSPDNAETPERSASPSGNTATADSPPA